MEEKRLLEDSEKGSALLVVLMALLVLLPLALLASVGAFRWQRQASQYRELIRLEFSAQGAYHDAVRQLQMGYIDPEPGSTRRRIVA